MPSVVILGANGFIGSCLTRRCHETGLLRPIAAVRHPPQTAMQGIEHRVCDAADLASVAAALTGADYAVNCVAGSARTMLAATRNLAVAARLAGLRRIVHLSSMAVYGSATGLVDETARLDGRAGRYARAKIGCEATMQAFAAGGGAGVILRPGIVHGPGSEQWTGRIGRMLRGGRIGDLGAAGDGICNLVHVGDLAAAIVAALLRPGVEGQIFNVGDRDPGTWNEYFVRLARAIGAVPVRRVGRRRLALEARLFAAPLKLGRLAGADVPEPLTRGLLALWGQVITLDPRRADEWLGFERTPLDLALEDAGRWYRESLLF
jgi:nucleoside-diphosphate-sugar epimerase